MIHFCCPLNPHLCILCTISGICSTDEIEWNRNGDGVIDFYPLHFLFPASKKINPFFRKCGILKHYKEDSFNDWLSATVSKWLWLPHAYQHIGFDLQTLFSRLVNKDSHILTPFFAVLSESLSQPQLVGVWSTFMFVCPLTLFRLMVKLPFQSGLGYPLLHFKIKIIFIISFKQKMVPRNGDSW